jgi:hypothetical protein
MKKNILFLLLGVALVVFALYFYESENPNFLSGKKPVNSEQEAGEDQKEEEEIVAEDLESAKEENEEVVEVEEEKVEVFTVDSDKFYINGIGIGMTKREVYEKVGPPNYDGLSDIGENYQEYDDKILFYYDDILYLIVRPTTETDFAVNFWSKYNGKKYDGYDGEVLYLFSPTTDQLIFFKDDGEGYSLYLTNSDGNFEYGVDTGVIVEVK